jgi:phospholipid/cholesterol/gamma-HCH transport system ATP-binding protein
MISLIDVHKELGGRKVLDGLNLQVKKGETLVVIGRSGTGKSVTLKHMVGLMSPDQGRIVVDGEEIQSAENRDLERIRKRFGVLFQSGALLNSLSVRENIALPLREHTDLPEAEIQDRVSETLELIHLQGRGEVMPGDLSGGMKKRVGLARAIVRDPEIILYDEPTSGLDPVMSNTINDLILSMQERLNVTSVVVTHDMSSAYRVGNRIALLNEGRIIQVDTPKDLIRTKNPMVRQFIDGDTKGPLTDNSNE